MMNAKHLRGFALLMTTLMLVTYSCTKKPTSSTNEPADQPVSTGSHLLLGPEGIVGDSLFDFGYAPQKSRISHAFWLHNGYDDTLTIVQIKPG